MKDAAPIVLVAGATRGAGRGIAVAFGEAGAVVHCTGRSTRGGAPNHERPETIEETAELVEEAGGRGVAHVVDHTDETAVRELCERIRRDHGRIDVLVNDIWGGDALTEWGKSFHELDVAQGFRLLERAVHTHVITSRHAGPLVLEAPRGLIVEVTDGAFRGYRMNLFYDLAKSSVMRLAYGMSVELENTPHTALAITPGFLRSEAMLDHFGVTEANWREAIGQDPHFAASETPLFVGRVLAALASDPDVGGYAGQTLTSWELARKYGVRDVDGRQPHWEEHLDRAVEEILAKESPTDDELQLLAYRGPQLDFDPARADQRRRLRAVLARCSEK